MTDTQNEWTAHLAGADLTAAAAILAVAFGHTVTRRAVIDTPLEHVMYEAVAAGAMLAIAYRTRLGYLGLPETPTRFRPSLRFIQSSRSLEVFCLTSITVGLAIFVRGVSERAAALIWPPAVVDRNANIDTGCISYNDPACTGDTVTVDILEVLTAAVGEEFAYRFALMAVLARFTSVRIAIVAHTAIWALSHTGFERGYGAVAVAGLFAVGLVYAVSLLWTGSIWPAIIAHALHNLGVAAFDHDLRVVVGFVVVANGLAAIGLALAISMPVSKFITRRD